MAKVLDAKLNRPYFIKGLGNVPVTLPPQSETWNLEMETCEIGIRLDVTVRKTGGRFQAYIPYSNVDGFTVEPEAKTSPVRSVA